MNNVCLCVGKYAENPFYVKFLDLSLYSIEELCYYFIERVHLLDESVLSMELVKWIRGECGLAELADELEGMVRKRVSEAVFVTTILEYAGMYDSGTVKNVERVLKELSALTPVQRYKRRAQQLYSQGFFSQSLEIYSELASVIPETDAKERALMYYNMAAVYAMDFAYSEAAELYYRSYMLSESRQTRILYILAKKMYLSDYAFGGFRRENPEWEQDFLEAERMYVSAAKKWEASKEKGIAAEIKELRSSGSREAYDTRLCELIERLKKDYRRQTGG